MKLMSSARPFKRLLAGLLSAACALALCACASEQVPAQNSAPTQEISSNDTQESEMILKINGRAVPVSWEDNASVRAIKTDAAAGDITVTMSRYGGNEQVGSLGKSYESENRQLTTSYGDIVLYSSSNIVVFYGSNTWSYTRLGKIDLPADDITALLSNGDVTLTLSIKIPHQ